MLQVFFIKKRDDNNNKYIILSLTIIATCLQVYISENSGHARNAALKRQFTSPPQYLGSRFLLIIDISTNHRLLSQISISIFV